MRAVTIVIRRVFLVRVEIPPDEIVNKAVAVVVLPVGPTALQQEILAIDIAVPVDVGDILAIGLGVQVAKGDQAITGRVDEQGTQVRGNLALVQPNILIEIRVREIHAAIKQTHDDAGTSCGKVPSLRRVDVGVDLAA